MTMATLIVQGGPDARETRRCDGKDAERVFQAAMRATQGWQ